MMNVVNMKGARIEKTLRELVHHVVVERLHTSAPGGGSHVLWYIPNPEQPQVRIQLLRADEASELESLKSLRILLKRAEHALAE
jgi:predicted transcriptional regulator